MLKMTSYLTHMQHFVFGIILFETIWNKSDAFATESIFQRIGGVQLSHSYAVLWTRSRVQCLHMCLNNNQCITVSYHVTNSSRICKLNNKWMSTPPAKANKGVLWDIYFDRAKFDVMIIPTPDAYNYTALDDHGITLGNGQKFATFEIKACSDVHILLMQINANFDIKIFEIIIGGWNNTASAMRYERQGFDVITVTHQPLDCSTSLPFWVSWFDSQVHVGSGFKIGQNEFMSIPNAYNTQINFIAISTGFGSTGEWTFYKLKP